jgi:hypothetical protein
MLLILDLGVVHLYSLMADGTLNHLKTKRRLLYLKTSSYRAVNTHLGYKNQSVMLYGSEVAVCSEINTKHIYIYTVLAESTIIE